MEVNKIIEKMESPLFKGWTVEERNAFFVASTTLKNKRIFSEEEVIELLTAYGLSDIGTFSIEEVKAKWPNSYEGIKEGAKKMVKYSSLFNN